MACPGPIVLFVPDEPVLSSLQFSLAIEGFAVLDGAQGPIDLSTASAVVIDEAHCGDGFAALDACRTAGLAAPAFILATSPNLRLRGRASAAGGQIVEKPLRGDELGKAIRASLSTQKAA